jgi:type IV pilus assembly protein PilC
MATSAKDSKMMHFAWEGKDKKGKVIKGQINAPGEAFVKATLRRQGVIVTKIKKQSGFASKGKVKDKDIALFTRQLATMMKAGVPLLQTFDIVGKGHSNPAVAKLLGDIKAHIEKGSSLSDAFRKYPLIFDNLYCNLVAAGEQAGILESLLDRLATYKEKIIAIKSKIKSALMYPSAIIVVAFIIVTIIMLFVIPAFKELFSGFGANLPTPTLIVMAISDFFVAYWWAIFSILGGIFWFFFYTWKRSPTMQAKMDGLLLKAPVIGPIIRKATIARFSRTLATMAAAGVPLVEALDSVAGASGNRVYYDATKRIQAEVNTGTSLTTAMQNTSIFPNMVVQMTSIGEESGSLDAMLAKIADYYEEEVDDAVAGLSSLMEPIIMVVLGTIIGGLVVAMYMPIFEMGNVV